MRASRVVLPLAAVALALPASVRAQAAAGIETRPLSTWHFQLSANGSWYENPYFVGVAGEQTAWSSDGRATLGWQRRFRQGSFSLSGFGGVIYYPEIEDFNQPTYGGSFSLNYTPSPRTTFTLGSTFERTNTRSLGTTTTAGAEPPVDTPAPPGGELPPTAEGPPLPTSAVDYIAASIGLEQRLSQRWSFGMSGSFSTRSYDDERLVASDQVYANARLGRQVGPRGQIAFTYGFSSSWFEVDKQRSHQFLLGGRRQPPAQGMGFELAGGVGYMESTGAFYPAGRASVTAQGRRARLSLAYYRDFGQAYGYGRQTIGDVGDASLSWTPVRRVSLHAGYNYGYRRDPADESYTIVSSIVSAGFSWDVGAGFDFGAYYSWERNETEGLPLVEGSRVTASLAWGVDFR